MSNTGQTIMVTFENDNVAVFTHGIITLERLKSHLINKGFKFLDVFEVKSEDMQYYLYEPLYLEKEVEKRLMGS